MGQEFPVRGSAAADLCPLRILRLEVVGLVSDDHTEASGDDRCEQLLALLAVRALKKKNSISDKWEKWGRLIGGKGVLGIFTRPYVRMVTGDVVSAEL